MRRLREHIPLVVAVAGFLSLIVVAALIFMPGDDEGLPRGLAERTPAAAPAGDRMAQSGDNAATMTLHDKPRPVPGLRFKDGSGDPVLLADFRGKLVLLNLWATWCGPCREEMPTLDRLQAALGGPDFEVVALSIDRAGIGVVDAFYAEVGVTNLARYIDESGKVTQELNALGLPTTLLLDREGREIARHVGPAEWDTPEMQAFFRRQLSQESGALPQRGPVRQAGAQDTRAITFHVSSPIPRTAIRERNPS